MKDALVRALKAYGGPDGLIEDLRMYAESRKEEAQDAHERLTDKDKLTAKDSRKLRVLYALETYWSEVEDALDTPAQEVYTTATSITSSFITKSTRMAAWKVNPERIVLK
jgi:hypothetical protein